MPICIGGIVGESSLEFIKILFGGWGSSLPTTLFALGAVLVLIVLVLWGLKLLSKASNNVGRGRNRRLSVVDTLAIDPKRQLIIVRRDNVEHLLLTGGPQDVVVETGIAVDEALAAASSRRPLPNIASVKLPPRMARKPAVTPAAAPAPAPTGPVEVPVTVSPLDRLRDLGKPATGRRPTSLRHTGLMRPVSHTEPTLVGVEKTNGHQPDSVKHIVNTSSDQDGQSELGELNGTTDEPGYTADRN